MNGSIHNGQDFLKRLTDIVEANLHNDHFGANELARELNMSRSTLHRKVKESTKLPISRFICQLRLKKALTLLRETSLSVSETAYECGFNSVAYFSKCFHDYYGYSPGSAGDINEQELPAENDNLQKSGRWKEWLKPAAGIIIFALIIFLISESIYFGISDSGREEEEKPKTIALLPLKFEGSDSTKIIAGGLTEAVLNRLMEIENLVIRSKTSLEKYRETTKTIKEIAKELEVDYVFEITGYQNGNIIQFQVNMADAVSDAYLWREPFKYDINEESSLDVQNRIAKEITAKTKTKLSPLEKVKLKERLTDNPAAHIQYLQGLNHLDLAGRIGTFSQWQKVTEETFRAKKYFEKALQLDSGFIEAYLRLAHIYIDQINVFNRAQRNNCLDSGLIMADKAILLCRSNVNQSELRSALSLKSNYMWHKGDIKESRRLFEESLKYSSNHASGENQDNFAKYCHFEDYYEVVAAFYKYREQKPEEDIIPIWIYNNFSRVLFRSGFPELAEKYMMEYLAINLDTLDFYVRVSYELASSGNFEQGLNYANKALKITPNPFRSSFLFNKMLCYMGLKEYASTFEMIEEINKNNPPPNNVLLKSAEGFILKLNGQSTLADQNFQDAIKYLNTQISSDQYYYSHFFLAMNYAAIGEKVKALACLKEVENRTTIPGWIIVTLQYYPLFDNIRNEPEFIQLKKEFEDKFQKEHKKIASLLRQKGEI